MGNYCTLSTSLYIGTYNLPRYLPTFTVAVLYVREVLCVCVCVCVLGGMDGTRKKNVV